MKDFMLTYIDYVNEVNELMERTQFDQKPGEDLIGSIRMRSEHIFQLLKRNNAIVQQQIMPYLSLDYDLTAEEYQEFDEFAERLCTFSEYIDAALAALVRKKLLAVAEKEGNEEQTIIQQYAIGIACYLLYSKYEMFETLNVRDKVVPWFSKVAARMDHFRELSHASRGYVLRSLNNEALIFNSRRFDQLDDYMKTIRHTLDVFTSEEIHKLEPEINWPAFIRAVHRNCLRISDSLEQGYGLEYLPDVQKSAAYLTDGKHPGDDTSVIDQYSAIELANIQNQMDAEECVNRLDQIYAKRDQELFDRTGINQNVNIPSFSLLYEVRLKPVRIERMNQKVMSIIEYVNAFHQRTGLYSYNYAVANFIRYYPDLEGMVPFRHVLESLMLALHVPTYVHSRMVASICEIIGEMVLQEAPEGFVGCWEISCAEDARQKAPEILEFLRYAGLFHDIGKFYCIDVITQYSRRLFDDEFNIIKLHAKCGCEILSKHRSTACYAESALMHHITYDRRGGYTKEFMPEKELLAFISDIVHIADAIDAATDNIGRCYSACKTQEEIMNELINAPGSYNPVIVKALMNTQAQEKIRNVLNEVRSRIYENVYTVTRDSD